MAQKLPDFDKPPVSEVAMSVSFKPLSGWSSLQAGLFWSTVRKKYPQTETHPPIAVPVEKFGDDQWITPGVAFGFEADLARFWFLTDDGTRLMQLQRDHFVINWRKVRGDEAYPRYAKEMRPRFEEEWALFAGFVDEAIGQAVEPVQCELTYVNDVFRGEGWDNFEDALTLFSWWKDTERKFLPPASSMSVAIAFDYPDKKGRLHIDSRHVRRLTDSKEAYQIKLFARGAPRSGSTNHLLAWMDEAHEWIVKGFADVTSERAHGLWVRKQ